MSLMRRSNSTGHLNSSINGEDLEASARPARVPSLGKRVASASDGGGGEDGDPPALGQELMLGGEEEDGDDPPPPAMTRERSKSLPDVAVFGGRDIRVQTMREALRAKGFSEVDSVFDDSYLKSVMNRTKNGKQRTFEYSLEKLEASLQWRREYGAAQVTYEDVAASLSPQHMVWKGFDASGRPVLYAKPSDMDLSTYSTDNYLKAHVYLLEQGIAMIPKGQTTFVLVADASGMGKKHTDLKLMRQLAGIATTAYPDRLGMLLVGPVNMLVRGIWAVVSRLVSPSVASKIRFVRSPRAAVCAMLRQGEEPPEWLS